MTDDLEQSSSAYFDNSGEDADAVQEREAATLSPREAPGDRGAVGTRVRDYFEPTTPEEAERALIYFRDYCHNCQWEKACPGEACRVYREEKKAVEVIAGVPMRQGIT